MKNFTKITLFFVLNGTGLSHSLKFAYFGQLIYVCFNLKKICYT